jgi:hypothetical protein
VKDLASFYDSVRPHQHIRRDRQTDLLRSFEVDDQLKLFRLLNGQSDDRVLIKWANLVSRFLPVTAFLR